MSATHLLGSQGPFPGTRRLSRWLIAFFAAALCACTHIQLIGDYDETIDQGVTAVQKNVETYFVKLDTDPTTPYSSSFYDGIDVDLAVLTTRAQATPKYTLIEGQLTLLRTNMKSLRELDKISSRPALKDAAGRNFASSGLSTIEQQVGQILKLELALKRGDDTASGVK